MKKKKEEMKLYFPSSFEHMWCMLSERQSARIADKMQETSWATVAVCCLSTPRTSCSSALVALSATADYN